MTSIFVKATFNSPTKDLVALKKLANKNNVSVTSLVRKAIETELYLNRLEVSGGKLLIEKDGSLLEITRSWRRAS